MTTFLTFLADLTVTVWVCIVLGSWLIAGVLIAPRIGRMIRRREQGGHVNLQLSLPPVPPPVSRHSAAKWAAAWPVDDTARDAA